MKAAQEGFLPCFVNRELSWLRFNERVLEEAERPENPLCERLTFASIYQTNLDEFFMVRVGALIDQRHLSPLSVDSRTLLTASEQLEAVFEDVKRLVPRRDALYENLMKEVEAQGFCLVDFHRIQAEDSKRLEAYFDREIAPLIAPSIVGKKQPFPFLRGRAIYAVAVLKTRSEKERIGIIPCSVEELPRLIEVRSGVYMLLEELILHFLPKIFKEYSIASKSLIRVTRSADIAPDLLDDEEADMRAVMENLVQERKRLSPVRLELSRELGERIVDVLCTYLEIDRSQVFFYKQPLDLSFVFQMQDALRGKSELFYPRRVPQRSASLDLRRSLFEQIREKDVLLHYPYESFEPFLQFLREAATDPAVQSIRMTLYRVAKESKVIELLAEAAENGKEVLVLVELKARFDEENNIGWSRTLEKAGCRVIYGMPVFKVHSKLCLITRMENGERRYYTQIGTGNYNEKTARLYTDFSLFTAKPAYGLEAAGIFYALKAGKTLQSSDFLMVAPHAFLTHLFEEVDRQIERQKTHGDGYIGIKINSLSDIRVMEKFMEASSAGVKIDLIVRGICCLLPGVPGRTDNIRVKSIVGRFLEHSRLYLFGGEGQASCGEDRLYIASADLMTRNTVRRVEVGAPITDADLKKRLRRVFETALSDTVQAREMSNNGRYYMETSSEHAISSQEMFLQEAYERADKA